MIREIFYENFGRARPNRAHEALARLEAAGTLKCLITQNIDNLHYIAGSRNIVEFHGNSRLLLCLECGNGSRRARALLATLPPAAHAGASTSPTSYFSAKAFPRRPTRASQEAAGRTDVMLVVGSTGEVYPAALVPRWAAEAGAKIIEINPWRRSSPPQSRPSTYR